MTATDVLRRLLDECGVEHKDFFDQTWWEDSDGAAYIAVETRPLDNNNPSTKLMLKRTATPEQAIAVTLGSCNCSNNCTNSERTETCHPVISDNLTESEGAGDAWADCSECGHLLFVLTDPNSQVPNFCPNCGRRVVQ